MKFSIKKWLYWSSLVFIVSCAGNTSEIRNEDEIRADYARTVANSQECERDDQCVAFFPGCPLGCAVAINSAKEEELRTITEGLRNEFFSNGESCFEPPCLPPIRLACVHRQCTLQ